MKLFSNCTTIYIYGVAYKYLLVKSYAFLASTPTPLVNFIDKITEARNC